MAEQAAEVVGDSEVMPKPLPLPAGQERSAAELVEASAKLGEEGAAVAAVAEVVAEEALLLGSGEAGELFVGEGAAGEVLGVGAELGCLDCLQAHAGLLDGAEDELLGGRETDAEAGGDLWADCRPRPKRREIAAVVGAHAAERVLEADRLLAGEGARRWATKHELPAPPDGGGRRLLPSTRRSEAARS